MAPYRLVIALVALALGSLLIAGCGQALPFGGTQADEPPGEAEGSAPSAPDEPPGEAEASAPSAPEETEPVEAEAPAMPATGGENRRPIVLLGHPAIQLGQAAVAIENLGSYAVTVNATGPAESMVLFWAYAPDGPMPGLRRGIEGQAGRTYDRAAILLTGVDVLDDPELEQLVVLEMRELLDRYLGDGRAYRLDVLRWPADDLGLNLAALFALPPDEVRIGE